MSTLLHIAINVINATYKDVGALICSLYKGFRCVLFVGHDLTAAITCSPVIYEPIRAFPNGGKTQSKEDI